MRKLLKNQRKDSRRREAGASLVEYLLLICLISLGVTASLKLFSKSIETKGYTMACSLDVQGGGTQGVVGSDEREGGEHAVAPPAEPDFEDLPAFEARAIAACVRTHLNEEPETATSGGGE